MKKICNSLTPHNQKTTVISTITKCDHCGEDCDSGSIYRDEMAFCCNGCDIVYTLLKQNNLDGNYYRKSGEIVGIRPSINVDFSYLKETSIVDKLLSFKSVDRCKISLSLPAIHCISCVWLLENLTRLNAGVVRSRVNFMQRRCTITYDPNIISLFELVKLLSSIGYEPKINLADTEQQISTKIDRGLYYKLGIAGFAFGNIMLLSFPDYLGIVEGNYLVVLGYINIILAIPVLIYAASDYLRSAWNDIVTRQMGINIPIALGILIMFGRSVIDILTQSGEGYLDSFAGFVFFLLIGRWFQSVSFDAISFDRDFKSFLPVSVQRLINRKWESVLINEVAAADRIRILNNQILPCDGILRSTKAKFDYSFVTGEEDLSDAEQGDKVYAGGRLIGQAIQMVVSRSVNESDLTQLWREDAFVNKKNSKTVSLIGRVGHYFVMVILLISVLTLSYWLYVDSKVAADAATSVLIIACPCVLALSVPFIYGNMIRILFNRSVYSKNTETLERVAVIDTVVFDKTGTLTEGSTLHSTYVGKALSDMQLSYLRTLTSQSIHPLSKCISSALFEYKIEDVSDFFEKTGYGIQGIVDGHLIRMGSSEYLFGAHDADSLTSVHVEIDDFYMGRYEFKHQLRDGTKQIISELAKSYNVHLISGDKTPKDESISQLFPVDSELLFEMKPKDKLDYIKQLQHNGGNVMMIGDGLNDAGALRQSNVGVVLSTSHDNFTPASDLIITAAVFKDIGLILKYIGRGRYILGGGLLLALLYNTIGLCFAISGQLSPIVAAILMPISSVSIMVYGMLSTWLMSKMIFR